MSSDYVDEGEIPHFAYLVLRAFPPSPTEIAVLCHHAETNDMFLPSGRIGSSPITRMNKVKIFLVETLVLQIGFRLLFDLFSIVYFYWEQTVTKNNNGINYSMYVVDLSFRDFIMSFRNVGGAQAVVPNIKFQEKLFKLEPSGKPIPNRIRIFEIPLIAHC